MRLTVYKYNSFEDYHKCLDETGEWHNVDLFISGNLVDISRESIEGKVIECEYLQPYLEVAEGVKVVEEADAMLAIREKEDAP